MSNPLLKQNRSIRINVEYYNRAHQQLLENFSKSKEIEKLINEGITIDDEEFMIHTIFTEQKDYDGFRTYADLKALFPRRKSEFEDYFSVAGGTIRARFPAQEMENHRIERVGVAASLIAMNKIYGLHEADWKKIPITQDKDFDFSIASDGQKYIKVESKGSVVETVHPITPTISQHKASIESKKRELRQGQHASELLGTITSIPTNTTDQALCRLLDPEGDVPIMEPLKYKLLARMTFYLENLSLISQARMLIALRNRIAAILNISNYRQLDGIYLTDQYGDMFGITPFFTYGRTQLLDGLVFGRVFPINPKEYAFFGFEYTILKMLIEQHFSEIARYQNYRNGTYQIEHEGLVRYRDFTEAGLEFPKMYKEIPRQGFLVPLRGRLLINASGRAIGLLQTVNG